jgi:hypothetical protein
MSIETIRERMQSAGSHWWDNDTMRFFGTRVCSDTFENGGNVWFVTSEQPPHGPRAYTVRRYDIASNQIDTEGELCGFSSRSGALRSARSFAGGNAAVASGKLTPTTPADETTGAMRGIAFGKWF